MPTGPTPAPHGAGTTVTYYALASRVKPQEAALATPDVASSLAPAAGPAAARQAQMLAGYATYAANQFRFDQSTFGVGLRWDFASNAALKLQVDRFHVRQNGAAGWRNHDGRLQKAHWCPCWSISYGGQ